MTHILGTTKRDRLGIIAEILSMAADKKKKTHIIGKCNLSYKMFQQYAHTLLGKGLIRLEDDSGEVFYKTTDKGQEFIRRYQKMNEILIG